MKNIQQVSMLTENDVVKAVSNYLTTNGYAIISRCETNEKGYDIVAQNYIKGTHLYIEAKGETSSGKTSKRYGSPFDDDQVNGHVSKAIIACLKVISIKRKKEKFEVGIALPNTLLHKEFISRVAPALHQLNIQQFWVNQDLSVEKI